MSESESMLRSKVGMKRYVLADSHDHKCLRSELIACKNGGTYGWTTWEIIGNYALMVFTQF